MHILLVEDTPHDVFFVQKALEQIEPPVQLSVVQDGEHALHFLGRRGPYTQVTPPDLVLLDLNLPGKRGTAVLAELGRQRQVKCPPVIMFTSSDHPQDIDRCYTLGANAYITKPWGLTKLVSTLRRIIAFWATCQLPRTR